VESKSKNSFKAGNTGQWIGVGLTTGIVVFAVTDEPTWIAIGVIVGAALGAGWKKLTYYFI